MRDIQVGDIIYDPIKDLICVVTGFGEDKFGQGAIAYLVSQKKQVWSSAWIVFRYFKRLDRPKQGDGADE